MKIIIIGNSGSGKSTFAKSLQSQFKIPLLDLDTVAWKKSQSPQREELLNSKMLIDDFIAQNSQWVIEGGYSDLMEYALKDTTKVIFLNPGVETCIENCRNRPFESHKYKSIQEQNSNLEMLIEWVDDYYKRDDSFSYTAHRSFFESFSGEKHEYNSNKR